MCLFPKEKTRRIKPEAGGASKASKNKPADIAGEDLLILHRGQLLQISKQHPDGWAFGSVCYDEQCPDGRPPSGTEGFSTYSGWFPLERTVSFGLTLIREPTKEPARPTLTRY